MTPLFMTSFVSLQGGKGVMYGNLSKNKSTWKELNCSHDQQIDSLARYEIFLSCGPWFVNHEKIFAKTENLIVACISINLLHTLLSSNTCRLVLPVNRDTDKSFFITTSRRFKCVIEKWVTPPDFVAWRLSLFLWAFTSAAAKNDANQASSFLLGWEKVRTLQEDQEANSKDRNNCLIKQPWAAKLREYSFVFVINRNCEESLQTFHGFKFFAKYFKLFFISVNDESFESFKKRS